MTYTTGFYYAPGIFVVQTRDAGGRDTFTAYAAGRSATAGSAHAAVARVRR